MKRNNEGFTLIEVLLSIVILGLIVVPICSSLVMAVRINAKAESILDAKLAVSSAVEELMASGIDSTKNYDNYDTENMDYTVTRATDSGSELPYYNVTVIYKDSGSGKELVSVTTQIRAGGGAG